MSNILELAKKLKALADRGIGGEKLNAERMLTELLKKHNISLEEIEEPDRRDREFDCQKKQEDVMKGCIYSVMGKDVDIYRYRSKKTGYIVSCTNAEYLEIDASFAFFWRHYTEELKIFLRAFIQKNKLIPFDADSYDRAELTPEEERELNKTLAMMEMMDRKSLRKALTTN